MLLGCIGQGRAASEGTALPNTSHTYSGATQASWQRAAEAEQESEDSPSPGGHISDSPDILVGPYDVTLI